MTLAIFVATALAALPAGAQQGTIAPSALTAQVDARFAPWLGCWRLDDDPGAVGLRICVTPDAANGVKLETLVGAQRGTVERIVADGVAHPVTDPGCKGTERAEWSADGERVFRFTEVACGGEGARTLATVSFLSRGPSLVRVQFVDTGLSKSVRVQRYRRALDQKLPDGSLAPQPSARLVETSAAEAAPWSVDDVIEASGKLPADAVQAALIEVDAPFALSKQNLVAMADAGVQPGVIDLMVALTYPKKLAVTGPMSASSAGSIGMGGFYGYDPFYSPIVPASYFFADCYSPFAYGYWSYMGCRPYYSTYGYWGGYYPYGNGGYSPYYPGGSWVVVDPGRNPNPGQPAPEGRVVNGRGYTQVHRPVPPPSVAGGRSGSSGSGGGNSGATSSAPSGVSSGGYSSGGSSGSSGSSSGSSGGRTAVPRPGGI